MLDAYRDLEAPSPPDFHHKNKMSGGILRTFERSGGRFDATGSWRESSGMPIGCNRTHREARNLPGFADALRADTAALRTATMRA